MNKEKLLAKADELIAQSNILNAKANELKELANKQENIIYVPDNIKISKWPSIHNWNHRLYYALWFDSWLVCSWSWDICNQYKLTPCKYEDLKPWDVFYRYDNINPNFDNIIWYAIKLKEWYQFWSGKDCNYSSLIYNYNWKVKQI